jgi:hypothetical protein
VIVTSQSEQIRRLNGPSHSGMRAPQIVVEIYPTLIPWSISDHNGKGCKHWVLAGTKRKVSSLFISRLHV